MIVPLILAIAAPMAAPVQATPAAAEPLTHRAALWRLLAATGQPLPYRDAAEAAVLARTVQQVRWRRLIENATPFASTAGEAGATLWWNAAADAGLLVRWRRDAGGWRAVEAKPFVGGGSADPVAAAAAARAALVAGTAAGSERVALSRATEATVSLTASSAERLVSGEGLLIRGALPVDGADGALGRWLATMPLAARRALVPVLRRPSAAGGEAIWWQSTATPEAVIVLTYPADATVLMPSAVDVVDLRATQGGTR